MDCRKAQQNIDLYIDGMIESVSAGQLERHIASCTRCQKTLDAALSLKRALGELSDLEPPANLTQSAIKKAKRRPLYACLTAVFGLAAAAVVIAAALLPESLDAKISPEMDLAMLATGSSQECAACAPMVEGARQDDGFEEPLFMPSPDKCVGLRTFATEEEFAAEFGRGYYKPAVLPEGSALENITEDGCAVVFNFRLESGGNFEFGWIIASGGREQSEECGGILTGKLLLNHIKYEQYGQRFWISATDDMQDINAYREAKWRP
ncbi:MAG: zf-HC2 domain-containing protein [Christensenellales bacterium]